MSVAFFFLLLITLQNRQIENNVLHCDMKLDVEVLTPRANCGN